MSSWLVPAAVSLIVSIIFATVRAIWTIFHKQQDSKTARITRTIDLYNQFYSAEYLRARHSVWFWLGDKNHSLKPEMLIWSKIWSAVDQTEREKSNDLSKILSFWYKIYSLDTGGFIDRELAINFFGHQFKHWNHQLSPLAKNTMEHDKDKDDIFEPFLDNKMKWLEGKNQTYDPHAFHC